MRFQEGDAVQGKLYGMRWVMGEVIKSAWTTSPDEPDPLAAQRRLEKARQTAFEGGDAGRGIGETCSGVTADVDTYLVRYHIEQHDKEFNELEEWTTKVRSPAEAAVAAADEAAEAAENFARLAEAALPDNSQLMMARMDELNDMFASGELNEEAYSILWEEAVEKYS
jgi:hypothetical protein